MKEKKYSIEQIQGYADMLFEQGMLQVPQTTIIKEFLHRFKQWSELADKFTERKKK